jgi:GNAT superfamily N-acetyltransferase
MWTIDQVDFDHPDAARLRSMQRAELDERYGSDDHEPGTAPTAADVPVFLVAKDSTGAAVACGGLRPLPDSIFGKPAVEVKRMFVERASRGSGVSTAVLRALEARAEELGVDQIVLETGPLQPDAVRFYEREGYERIPRYGAYVDSDASICYRRKTSQ